LYLNKAGNLTKTQVYLSRADWGKIIVQNLQPLTQYCFFAIAKNKDGDARYAVKESYLTKLESFDQPSSVNHYDCNFYLDHSQWNICQGCSGNSWYYSSAGGCTAGSLAYSGTGSCFAYSPYFDITGQHNIIVRFDISNSYIQQFKGDALQVFLQNDFSYYGLNANIYFDTPRNCYHYELSFDLSGYSNGFNSKFECEH
jgi:hypothetical protein